MLLFRKEWYSLNETVTLLNEYFKLDPFNDIPFKTDDIIQYFMDGYLKLTIRAGITNKRLYFFEDNSRAHEFDLFDVNYPVGDDEIHEYSFKNENCFITKAQDKNLWLTAYGLFELIPDGTTIRRSKIKGEAFLIGGLYPFNSLSNEKKLAICCKKPFPIPFSQILISRDDIIDTIKTIKELEQNSQLEINSSNQDDTQKDEIIETLRARIEELENQLKNQSAVNSEQVLEYDGDLPAGTNEDKLAYFFELTIDPALLNDGGEMPTYSQLYTRLNRKHKHKTIPSKNTIKKYLNQ